MRRRDPLVAPLYPLTAPLPADEARRVDDFEIPPMSSYQAFQIDRGDTNVLDYFVDELIKLDGATHAS